MNPNGDFSIVVQGPFDNHIWNNYKYTDNYLKYVDKIIVSCYDTDDTQDFENYIKNNNKVILTKNPCPTFHCNPCNMYVHAFSTLRGLEMVETKFTIKIRSNEYFTQIDKIIESMEKFPDKYLVCNVHTYKVKYKEWKVSDHLFAGETKFLKLSMQQTLDWCHQQNTTADKHQHLGIEETNSFGQTENIFFLAYLKHRGINIHDITQLSSIEAIVKIMRDNLSIVEIEQLSPYIISNHGGPNGGVLYADSWNDDQCAKNIDEL